ncbi:MAG: hypothetical protein QOE93_152, partial [Actinomycetota bacterium]|nr:hypothetical protein [Actinomycetota bacterium]
MQYRVLGPFEVQDEERVLDLGRPKQRAVLAVLVLEANGVVSLDRLIDLLWGDERPAQSTASLQVYVSNLRRVLEPHRPPNRPPTVLLTRPPGYVLRIGPAELDAVRFEALAAEGHRLLAAGRLPSARLALEEALALWRGEPLAEYSFQRFAQPSIARWTELRHVAIEDRIEADIELGAHGSAVAALKGLVVDLPLRERLWGLLMVALYRDGRQGDALRTYAEARQVLIEKLGVEPGHELRRIESAILAQAPSVGWRRAPQAGTPPPIILGRESTHRTPAAAAPPMVGRTSDVARLDVALDEAAAGRGRIVLVSGEPGIGKTRLAEELVDRGLATGATVAWGGNNEGEGAPAFWPWMQVLRTVLARSDQVAWPEDARAGAPWLAHLVPEAATTLGSPGSPPALDAESARFEL